MPYYNPQENYNLYSVTEGIGSAEPTLQVLYSYEEFQSKTFLEEDRPSFDAQWQAKAYLHSLAYDPHFALAGEILPLRDGNPLDHVLPHQRLSDKVFYCSPSEGPQRSVGSFIMLLGRKLQLASLEAPEFTTLVQRLRLYRLLSEKAPANEAELFYAMSFAAENLPNILVGGATNYTEGGRRVRNVMNQTFGLLQREKPSLPLEVVTLFREYSATYAWLLR